MVGVGSVRVGMPYRIESDPLNRLIERRKYVTDNTAYDVW